jgi:alkylated DNA nucleotide flippase Atl1
VSRRAKSLASVVYQIVELVPPAGGGTGAVTTYEDICATVGCLSVRFDDLPSDDFLQIDM